MPIKANYFSPFNKRFDFGVPLEDIFPPNDVHPRLKYIFEESYKLYINNSLSVEQVVRQLQGSLQTRLKLKHQIIHDVHYDIKPENIEVAPGAYFWLIRHFLGLLPIPLLPTYSQEIHFDWIGLSEKCKNFLRYYESQRDRKYKLDYELAENLNLLPFENFLLLTVLIHFIRKLSKNKAFNGQKIDRRTLLFLCKYYCASICVRPYTPGHKDNKMFPLFFYIVLRWHTIEKYCRQIGHPAYFLEGKFRCETYKNYSIRDNWVQTTNFSPEIITVYKNLPYSCNDNNYLKDTGSQTEQAASVDKCIQNSEFTYEEKTISVEDKKSSNLETGSLYPLADINSAMNDDKYSIQETSTPVNEKQGENLDDNAKFNFLSPDDTCNKVEWSDVVAETAGTVKKIEEYIYDDYDTFSKEEYNQIAEGSKNRGSLMHKLSKIGWTYTPENSAREDDKERTANHNELEDTYVRFEDVFEENGKYKTNGDCDDNNECEVEDKSLSITFKKYYDSKIPLCKNTSRSANKEHESEGKSKKNFSLKRFKLKLDFLRVLTPKKSTYSTPSYDNLESNVKYKKIKNIKSNTL